jgi:N2,N2-dimethylguanosine tRNA methyltransferase
MNEDIIEIVEGSTKLLVPKGSMTEKVPPKEPAFFNPRASLSRDLSIIVCSAFWKDFEFPKIFFDGLSGLGTRGLRVANEVKGTEKVIINDVNANALEIASQSARINNLENFEISEDETCRFLSSHSRKNSRASIVDIDPFGSPSKYIDCAIRATMHGGMWH